jgi:hypothetical protein
VRGVISWSRCLPSSARNLALGTVALRLARRRR